jgi:hypothetical protein
MTQLEDRLRAAIRAKADDMPTGQVPPLRLPGPGRESFPLAHGGGESKRPPTARLATARLPRRWLAPAAAAVLVAAVAAGSVAVSGALRGRQQPAATALGVPRYYVALTGPVYGRYQTGRTAEVRSTATGAVLARVTAPPRYAGFNGVTAAADDRTFVLAALEREPVLTQKQESRLLVHRRIRQLDRDTNPPTRFFVLRLAPASAGGGVRVHLAALHVPAVPAGLDVQGMAVSPGGGSLAVVSGTLAGSELTVYNLATDAGRSWIERQCRMLNHRKFCRIWYIGPGTGGTNPGTVSWTADGKGLAIIVGELRLLDTAAAGRNLLGDSRLLVSQPSDQGQFWRTAIITPDGRTVVVVGELVRNRPHGRGMTVRQQLATYSAATGRIRTIINNLPVVTGYEQVLWTSASGRVLVVVGARSGKGAGIISDDQYTPIPWSASIISAAW